MISAENIREILSGGDLRSLGKANDVAIWIGEDRKKFSLIFEEIFSADPVIAMRSADACEKAAKKSPKLLLLHKEKILSSLGGFHQQEVQWHIALMLGYLELDEREIPAATDVLQSWLASSKSVIVKVHCLQALADISLKHSWLKKEIFSMIESEMQKGSPAVKARGRKLLKLLS